MAKDKHKCPPHRWDVDVENVGYCMDCPAVKNFGELLRKDGVFVSSGQRGAKARQETLGKKRGRKKKERLLSL